MAGRGRRGSVAETMLVTFLALSRQTHRCRKGMIVTTMCVTPSRWGSVAETMHVTSLALSRQTHHCRKGVIIPTMCVTPSRWGQGVVLTSVGGRVRDGRARGYHDHLRDRGRGQAWCRVGGRVGSRVGGRVCPGQVRRRRISRALMDFSFS